MSRTFLVLSIGLAIGLTAGYLLFHEDAPARRSPVERAVPAWVASESGSPVTAETRAPEPTTEEKGAAGAQAIQPTADLRADAEIEEGLGRIVVDFGLNGGDAEFSVQVTTLDGKREVVSASWDSRKTWGWIDVQPGVHLVFWEPSDRIGRWGARVAVERGRVTRVRAESEGLAFELPIPAGLGRLDVAVRSLNGFPLDNLKVELRGSGAVGVEWLEGWTNADGRVRFEARPGACVVEVGGARLPATLVAGESVQAELRPRDTGELRIDLPANSPLLSLAWAGVSRVGAVPCVWWSGKIAGRLQQGWFFVPPGEYEIRWRPATTLPALGRARVQAGRATVFQGAPGGIRAGVEGVDDRSQPLLLHAERLEHGAWRLVALVDKVAVQRFERDSGARTRRLPFLPAGTYRVWATQRPTPPFEERTTERTVVQVGEGWTDVRLRFDRPR